ncbi:MAG: sugar ABC transporter permease [Spirochaetales bacterium]|nr:sugar ABC transporter permease [Spirochaetales bacterium]
MSGKNSKVRLSTSFVTNPARVLVSLVVPLLTFFVMRWSFIYMRDSEASKLLIGIVALTVGVGGVWALFWVMNNLVSQLPEKYREALIPFVFIGPAVVVLVVYLVYPAVRTIIISMYNRTGTEFVGLKNYVYIFSDPKMLLVLRNTLLWVLIVPIFSVSFGLMIAVLVDKLSKTWEKVVKSFIFLPMAISFVGASVIWRFIYYYQPAGSEQIGLLNALVTAFGGDPVAWLIQRPWNNLFLIVIMVWLQTGFAMVILSAAIKGVPQALHEAARIDGANPFQVFFKITVPYVQGTILTVLTTILFLVLKIFDVVFVMTSGKFDTGIVASRMYEEAFIYRNFGRGSALAVFLFLVVVPFIIRNVIQMRRSRKE